MPKLPQTIRPHPNTRTQTILQLMQPNPPKNITAKIQPQSLPKTTPENKFRGDPTLNHTLKTPRTHYYHDIATQKQQRQQNVMVTQIQVSPTIIQNLKSQINNNNETKEYTNYITTKTSYSSRIAVRLSSEEKKQIESLIKTGKFKNISQMIRTVLTEYLQKRGNFNEN